MAYIVIAMITDKTRGCLKLYIALFVLNYYMKKHSKSTRGVINCRLNIRTKYKKNIQNYIKQYSYNEMLIFVKVKLEFCRF